MSQLVQDECMSRWDIGRMCSILDFLKIFSQLTCFKIMEKLPKVLFFSSYKLPAVRLELVPTCNNIRALNL